MNIIIKSLIVYFPHIILGIIVGCSPTNLYLWIAAILLCMLIEIRDDYIKG